MKMNEKTREEVIKWLRDKKKYYVMDHGRMEKGIELILRILLEEKGV